METYFVVSPIEKMDVQDSSGTGNNTWTMSGYAAVFGHTATLFDSGFERMTVQIDREAFTDLFNSQDFNSADGVVHFNHGHDMKTAVAATDVPAGQPGSLELSVDDRGLRFFARVDKEDPDAVALAAKMRTGVIKQASFAFDSKSEFTFTESEDGPEETHRLITEVTKLYDVCAATRGVFTQTVSGLQQYARALGRTDNDSVGHPRRSVLEGETPIAPSVGEGATPPDERIAVRLAREELAEIRRAARYGGMFRKE